MRWSREIREATQTPCRHGSPADRYPGGGHAGPGGVGTGWLTRTVKDRVTGRDSLNLFNIKGEGPAGSVTASVVDT